MPLGHQGPRLYDLINLNQVMVMMYGISDGFLEKNPCLRNKLGLTNLNSNFKSGLCCVMVKATKLKQDLIDPSSIHLYLHRVMSGYTLEMTEGLFIMLVIK